MMRFRGLLILLAVVLALSTAVPAQAASTFSLRYWPTTTNVTVNTATWTSGMISLSYRLDMPGPWSLSINGDFGSQANWTGSWAGAAGGNDSFWSFNIHRRFGPPDRQFSIFAGYGNGSETATFAGSPQTFSVSGFRVGADMTAQLAGGWGFSAWAATSVGATGTWSWPAFPPSESSAGSHFDWGAVVQRSFGGWTVDLGYRGVTLTSAGTASFCNCSFTWSGFIVGITRGF